MQDKKYNYVEALVNEFARSGGIRFTSQVKHLTHEDTKGFKEEAMIAYHSNKKPILIINEMCERIEKSAIDNSDFGAVVILGNPKITTDCFKDTIKKENMLFVTDKFDDIDFECSAINVRIAGVGDSVEVLRPLLKSF